MRLLPRNFLRLSLSVALVSLATGFLSATMPTPVEASPSWSIVPSPYTNEGSALGSVSCVSTTFCMAVGNLIASWNGTSWSIVPGAPGSQLGLGSVSCVSTSFCMAVGSYGAESWNGSTWSMVPTPPVGTPYYAPVLNSVSCVSATSCVAVGEWLAGSGTFLTLIESWNGTTWSVVPSPSLASNFKGFNDLGGVSCVSPTWCQAVGNWGGDVNYLPVRTLIESWNGSTWSIVPSPNRTRTSSLSGVSCTSLSSCIAVGYHSGKARTLVESWNGSTWSVVRSPNKRRQRDDALNAISCVSPTSCQAVGEYDNHNQIARTLIEAWNGETWTITPSPSNPTGNDNELDGVSCVSASSCQAVGEYGLPAYFQTLIESYG